MDIWYYMIYFLFISKSINCATKYLSRFICAKNTRYIRLDRMYAFVINQTFHLTSPSGTNCQLIFTSETIRKANNYLINLQLIQMKKIDHESSISLLFHLNYQPLLKLEIDDNYTIFSNIDITKLLNANYRFWGENNELGIILNFKNRSILKLITVITPTVECDEFNSKILSCKMSHQSQKVCIEKKYSCDTWNNCPFKYTDESRKICGYKFITLVLVPSIVLSCSIFILGWLLMKITPCILNHGCLSCLRRHRRFSFGRQQRNYNPAMENFGMTTSRVSDFNITPDNIPQSPPKYQNINDTNITDHNLPPSYSDDMDITIVPGFFQRFFGKEKPIDVKTNSYDSAINKAPTIEVDPAPTNSSDPSSPDSTTVVTINQSDTHSNLTNATSF